MKRHLRLWSLVLPRPVTTFHQKLFFLSCRGPSTPQPYPPLPQSRTPLPRCRSASSAVACNLRGRLTCPQRLPPGSLCYACRPCKPAGDQGGLQAGGVPRSGEATSLDSTPPCLSSTPQAPRLSTATKKPTAEMFMRVTCWRRRIPNGMRFGKQGWTRRQRRTLNLPCHRGPARSGTTRLWINCDPWTSLPSRPLTICQRPPG